MPWPLEIQWTSEDVRAVVLNIIASVLIILVGDGLLRGLLSVVLGRAPRLRVTHGEDQNLADLDWAHLSVENTGLPLAPKTAAARRVVASGSIDGVPIVLLWATTAARPPEQVDIYRGHPRLIPAAVRARQPVAAGLYQNAMQPRTAYVTDAELLTQGYSGKPAPHPLTDGVHELALTVQAEDGTTTSERFLVHVPPWPGRITIQRA